ncbi:hypothetical protein M2161_009210 [Streptomyces sp. SAI-133]|uniref:hypothetical protein n=1 Tax=unclassified Streptomyces TaxID=2593676 RepID=UPI00247487A1|nr:hypothetical protein [Streptomyces sp. SAI-133]MDH6590019.1 hypothetical protein [Streptomyces sp. SAI-133]
MGSLDAQTHQTAANALTALAAVDARPEGAARAVICVRTDDSQLLGGVRHRGQLGGVDPIVTLAE